jgi:hypothetical protein
MGQKRTMLSRKSRSLGFQSPRNQPWLNRRAIFFEGSFFFNTCRNGGRGASFGRAGGNGSICKPETGAEIMQYSLIIYQTPKAFAMANDPAHAADYTAG